MTEKKIALVTGSNKGIGFATSSQLGRLGIKVLMAARDKGRGTEAVETLRSEGLDVELVQLELTDPNHIARVRETVANKYGRLDILVNNAGMGHWEDTSSPGSVATVPMHVLRETFDVNFFGLVELTLSMLPMIRKSPAGRIVNVSSILGSLALHSDPDSVIEDFKPFAYDASKTAVNAFTIHLAALLKGTPIKVNSVHPGWVKTDLGGKNAPMNTEEGAKTSVAFATLDENGPTGGFFHMGKSLPW